ncbi:MAG TPA: hypothetical protein VM911_01535 [Pyrinomonadaceae bacterium]|jgi:hypothetical protein|nr:hypothetical protein [Pyrinomonadaceae bacterium]
MQTTHTPIGLHWPIADGDAAARLSWLVNANAVAEADLSRADLEEKLMMMRRPVSIEKAYALFGLLLGALPSAAIFLKLFGSHSSVLQTLVSGWTLLFLLSSIACGLAGRFIGSKLSQTVEVLERSSWSIQLFTAPFLGTVWGATTGALGGLILFYFGAIFGAIFAAPVGLLAFMLFMPLHRLLSHGGMIEAQHLWPLACGVTLTMTALILGL